MFWRGTCPHWLLKFIQLSLSTHQYIMLGNLMGSSTSICMWGRQHKQRVAAGWWWEKVEAEKAANSQRWKPTRAGDAPASSLWHLYYLHFSLLLYVYGYGTLLHPTSFAQNLNACLVCLQPVGICGFQPCWGCRILSWFHFSSIWPKFSSSQMRHEI